MNVMTQQLSNLGPEIALLIGACACLVFGLASQVQMRRWCTPIAAAALVIAGLLTLLTNREPQFAGLGLGLAGYVKLAVVGVGLLILLLLHGVPESLRMSKDAESGREKFDAANVFRGEFFAFFLFSLTGVMLCAGASDLVWLFLALELTSLPTYVMVATSRDKIDAQESAVKYFFLGAMSAAVFLYGFAMIYGATGFTAFEDIRLFVLEQGVSPMMMLGMVLATVGIAFKIAAFPMHFYAADVYEGATTPVTTMLAFVPKTAGFVAIILLLGLVSGERPGDLPAALSWLLWIMAAVTMTAGNVLALLQSNVKRVLAYSSVAHSGYMLVGLVGGVAVSHATLGSGAAAVLFYVVAYGLATLGAFAVLACLERGGDEAQTYSDLAGLARRQPLLAVIMLLSVLSLIGLPPTIGFLGKIYLFGSAISAGEPQFVWLVVIAVVNSAISAVYYLRIASACFFGEPVEDTSVVQGAGLRMTGGLVAAVLALVMGLTGSWLVNASRQAAVNLAGPQQAQQQVAQSPQAD